MPLNTIDRFYKKFQSPYSLHDGSCCIRMIQACKILQNVLPISHHIKRHYCTAPLKRAGIHSDAAASIILNGEKLKLFMSLKSNVLSSEKQGDEVREWAMIELQGMLETRHPVPLGGRFIGDLHFTQKDVPILIIGHHILYGKVMTLEKPYGIMVKESGEGGETTGYNITAVIKKKLLFKTRPKPIIANVPKKI